ncbi:MAG: hypothetical protein Q9181_000186 [Wetmoreana brouardii]
MPKTGPRSGEQPRTDELSDEATNTSETPDGRRRSTPQAPKAWYGGGTWRRGSKAIPVTQVARESILAATNKASEAVTTARNPISRGIATPNRSPSTYLSRSKGSSTKSLPVEPSAKKSEFTPGTASNSHEPLSQLSLSSADGAQNKTSAVKQEQATDESLSNTNSEQYSERKATHQPQDVQKKKAQNETPLWRGWFPSYGETANPEAPKPRNVAAEASVSEIESAVQPEETSLSIELPSSGRETLPRTWLGLWSNANSAKASAPDAAPSGTLASTKRNVEPQVEDKSKVPHAQATDTAKSSGWAFWSTEASRSQGTNGNSLNVGKLALAGSPSQSHPESAVLNGAPKVPRTDPGPATLSQKARAPQSRKAEHAIDNSSELNGSLTQERIPEKEIRPRGQSKNLLLPPMTETYRSTEKPSLIRTLTWWWQYKQSSDVNNARFVDSPPRIGRALVIGVHGYFPAPLIRSVLGQPTGTSIRFADGAANAIQKWTETQGYSCEIEKVALEGEGKFLERVDLLWKLLLNWIDNIRRADFVMVACHSQGVPVATMLIAKLIDFGCVRDTRIGVCAMAGVNLGPFIDYKSRWIGGSAGELFDFARPDSQVSKDYDAALTTALRHGVRIAFVGSIDDQLVSLNRYVYELLIPQNSLAVQNALQTAAVGEVPPKKIREATLSSQNPYILPFSLRGLLEEDFVRVRLQKETAELLEQFDAWKPSTKVLKDVKFRLEGVRSKL